MIWKKRGIFIKSHKMVVGIGKEEIKILKKRFREFQATYPKLKILGKKEIGEIEPLMIKGREEEILALFSEDGYAVDFGLLAKFLGEEAFNSEKKFGVFLKEKVERIKYEKEKFKLETNKRVFTAKAVAVAAGSHSLAFARSLGYGKELFLLPVAGNFYFTKKKLLNGKVYSVQNPKLPFAAVHGDPNVHNQEETRFGPTAKVIPILERRHWSTFWDFFKIFSFDFKTIKALVKIISDPTNLKFILKNFIYDLPIIGGVYYARTVKRIVPTLKYADLKFGFGLGGIRPQPVNKETGKILMGEAEIIGKNIIFNITPSPGATAAFKTAERNSEKIIEFLGKDYLFYYDQFNKDFKT